MVNYTEDRNHMTIQELVNTACLNETYAKIVVSTLNALLAFTAFLGNAVVGVALQALKNTVKQLWFF